ncbi:MAG: YraN family protein [Gammaproteobacteria bacterium]|nr:YraN family protein [Gammaproteobacteria bacterium]
MKHLDKYAAYSTRTFGSHIESLIKRHLEHQGLSFLCANYTKKCGEIDLVFEEDCGFIVFVEVRYRRNQRYGGARTSVNRRKLIKLNRTAQAFLQQYKLLNRPARIDIVAVSPKKPRQCSGHGPLPSLSDLDIEWIKNAIENN